MKNCCDEYCSNYGCNQGRDCPARTSRLPEPVDRKAFLIRWLLAFAAVGLFAFLLVSR